MENYNFVHNLEMKYNLLPSGRGNKKMKKVFCFKNEICEIKSDKKTKSFCIVSINNPNIKLFEGTLSQCALLAYLTF